jgi:hypothetical protein
MDTKPVAISFYTLNVQPSSSTCSPDNMTRSTTQETPAISNDTATELSNLIRSMSAVVIDPNGPTGVMHDLASELAKSSLEPTSRSDRAEHYYALNLAEIPCNFEALTPEELANPRVQSVLVRYRYWFDAEDTDLLFEAIPSDVWELYIVSRAMVSVIMHQVASADARMPACSPQDHPDGPFWSRPEVE